MDIGDMTRTGERTGELDAGFLNHPGHAALYRNGRSTPRRCRHCGAPMRWVGRADSAGRMMCCGDQSCDREPAS